MRILAVSDVHGAYATLAAIIAREEPFDVLLLAGDLTTGGSVAEAGQAVRRVHSPRYRFLAVAGNMDSAAINSRFAADGCSLDGRGELINGVGFFGVSGSPPTPFGTPFERSEADIADAAEAGWEAVQDSEWTVFVPHAPPLGTTLDRLKRGGHAGSSAVREFILHRAPDCVVCGHIHEARGVELLRATRVVNCGPAGDGCYAMITIDKSISIRLVPPPS